MPSRSAGVPDVVPQLSRGKHRNPRKGACFMELVSYLGGERWSDHPACTHSLLASVARLVNDHTSDEGRPQLAELIPAVIGLTGDDLHIDALISLRCASIALPVAAADRQRVLAVSVLVCERVETPGNRGANLRTADAAGGTAVIAAGPVTDWGNPNLVRASKGPVFSVQVASGGSAEVLGWLAERSLPVVATTPDTDMLVAEADLTGPVAIAVGSEHDGLSGPWLERAETRVKIPMFGRVDSLNVAASAAVVVYEAVRQRMRRP